MKSRKKFGGGDLCDSLRMRAERTGNPQQVVCYRVGDMTKELNLEENR